MIIQKVQWAITRNCNLNCKHCYMNSSLKKYEDMSFDDCLEIINQIKECKVSNVSLTGGEPTLRKDFFKIVDALKNNEIKLEKIHTNGSFIDDSFIEKLNNRNLKPDFSLSFDGLRSHDWIRGIKTENHVINTIKKLNNLGFKTYIEMCLFKDNINQIEKNVEFLAQIGVWGIKINRATEVGVWISEKNNKKLSFEDCYNAFLDYIPKFMMNNILLELQLGGMFYCDKRLGIIAIPFVKHCTEKILENSVCEHSCNLLYINPEGQISPCVSLDNLDCGFKKILINKNNKLADVLKNEYFNITKNLKIKELFEINKECKSCKHKFNCGTGCRANAVIHGNTYFGCDPETCYFFKNDYFDKVKNIILSCSLFMF